MAHMTSLTKHPSLQWREISSAFARELLQLELQLEIDRALPDPSV